jgi:hypothetical protein
MNPSPIKKGEISQGSTRLSKDQEPRNITESHKNESYYYDPTTQPAGASLPAGGDAVTVEEATLPLTN